MITRAGAHWFLSIESTICINSACVFAGIHTLELITDFSAVAVRMDGAFWATSGVRATQIMFRTLANSLSVNHIASCAFPTSIQSAWVDTSVLVASQSGGVAVCSHLTLGPAPPGGERVSEVVFVAGAYCPVRLDPAVGVRSTGGG